MASFYKKRRIVTVVSTLIHWYQNGISPYKLPCCRFYPSCSEFARQSFEKHGVFWGALKTLKRLTKCHPLHPGGYDPV